MSSCRVCPHTVSAPTDWGEVDYHTKGGVIEHHQVQYSGTANVWLNCPGSELFKH